MATKIDIFNLTLLGLGAEIAMDPGQEDDRVETLDAIYETVRDATLRAHPWNFAKRRATVAKDSAAPAFEFSAQYTRANGPFDLRVWRLQEQTGFWRLASQSRAIFRVEGRKILIDHSGPLNYEYIARIVTESEFDPLFVMALASHLGWRAGYKITNDRNKANDAKEAYQEQLAEARHADAQEGSPEQSEETQLLDSRL